MAKKSKSEKRNKPLNILITGGSSGIGYHAVLELIYIGHNIILPCKNIFRANEVLTNIFNQSQLKSTRKGKIYTPIMDLSDLKSIDAFFSEIENKGIKIDILILNAGLQYTGSKTPRWSSQGLELTFAVNHLSHYYLTQKILPFMEINNDPKIIITSSEVHNPKSGGGKVGAKASLGNLEGLESGTGFEMIDGGKFNADKAYKDSKLCNILFAKKLSTYLEARNLSIPVIAWAPGLVISKDKLGFFRYSRKYNQLGQILFAFLARDVLRITTSNIDAGLLLCNLAILDKYNKTGFKYYSNKIISSGKFIFDEEEISNDAQRGDLSDKLWQFSKSLIDKINK